MMRKSKFVASLFVAAGCCLFVGGLNLYQVIRFWSDGQTGFMQSSDPALAQATRARQYHAQYVDVTYVTPSGSVSVQRKPLPGDMVRRLAKGQKIPVTFLKHDPLTAHFDGDEPDSPWWWLAAGILLVATSLLALRLYRIERVGGNR